MSQSKSTVPFYALQRQRLQVHSSDDEDIGNTHIPKVNLKQDWWKPLSKEDSPDTPEPAWSILSSEPMPVPIKHWASALAINLCTST
ncbi:hypothetical protein Tco_0115791 [Tanacetum coccineum]